jgi:drug/metabolite transporter (DMT)-like permease
MLVGPWLVLINKQLLTEKGFPYPILLSSLGVAASSITAYTLVDVFGVAQVSKASRDAVTGPNLRYWRTAFPVGFLYAASLATGNSAYLYIGVGLIQMLKSAMPVLILTFLYLGGVEKTPTPTVVASVALITVGTVVTCAGSTSASASSSSSETSSSSSTGALSNEFFGIFLFLVSSCFEAVRMVATQHLLTNAKFSVIEGQVRSFSSLRER